jgi:DNA-binding PadR family transcriptional regulator
MGVQTYVFNLKTNRVSKNMAELTKHEEQILLAIWKLRDNAYGVTIRQNIAELTGRSLNYGSLGNTLYSLVRKGLIKSRESQPQSIKGGRRKVLYTLTAEGRSALKEIYHLHQQAWSGVNIDALEKE